MRTQKEFADLIDETIGLGMSGDISTFFSGKDTMYYLSQRLQAVLTRNYVDTTLMLPIVHPN